MAITSDISGLDVAEEVVLTPAGERILEAASRLFYWYGIRAVGVERIAKEAQVIKKTIFDRFGSKDALVAAYLKRRDIRWRQRIRETLSRVEDNGPKAQLLAAFQVLEGWIADENPRGCAFVNAYAEITDSQHPGYQVIMNQKRWLKGFFTEIAMRAGIPEPAALSEKLMILYEGATVVNSMQLVEAPVATATALADSLIESQLGLGEES